MKFGAGCRSAVRFVLNIHEVENYETWKAVFDKSSAIRKEAGETRFQVLSCASGSKRIVHFSEWTSIAAARRFFESPELIEIRRMASVKSPEFIYLGELYSGDLRDLC